MTEAGSHGLTRGPRPRLTGRATSFICESLAPTSAASRSTQRDWHERVIRETPLRRWGTPEDVADLACFLVGPRATYLTGQVFRVNGGAVR